MTYVPKPIPTETIALGDDMLHLIEKLAENAHEIWARQRMSDGWKYGAARDDKRREHPCLVPYGELPESEKEYDRMMVIQTVKAVLAMEYRIEKQ